MSKPFDVDTCSNRLAEPHRAYSDPRLEQNNLAHDRIPDSHHTSTIPGTRTNASYANFAGSLLSKFSSNLRHRTNGVL